MDLQRIREIVRQICQEQGIGYDDAYALQSSYTLDAVDSHNGKPYVIEEDKIGFVEASGLMNYGQICFMMFPGITSEVYRRTARGNEVAAQGIWEKAFESIPFEV